MNGFFKLDTANVKSALVYGAMMFLSVFSLSVLASIKEAGSILNIDWIAIFDSGFIAAVPTLVFLISILKNILTNENGEFLGIVEVIPDKK